MKRIIVCALLLLWGCDVPLGPREIVEKPPEQYRLPPFSDGGKTVERYFDSPRAVQEFCAANGSLAPARSKHSAYTAECYVPHLGVVALPSEKAWPSKAEIAQLREHGWAHAYGWDHNINGAQQSGTAPTSRPPPPVLVQPQRLRQTPMPDGYQVSGVGWQVMATVDEAHRARLAEALRRPLKPSAKPDDRQLLAQALTMATR